VTELHDRLAAAARPGIGLVTVDSRVWLRIVVDDRPAADYLAVLDVADPARGEPGRVGPVRVVGSTPND
jgi:hypothetical protein